jgi:serine/threonine protein kinase
MEMSVKIPPAGFGQAQLPSGTRLNGIYEIDNLIAAGGMGEVYIGHVIETGDRVAVKILQREFCQNTAALTLFRKEASALHYVHDDAVVRYYVFAVEPVLGRPYLAMEFVEGRPLSDILEADGPLTLEAVMSLRRRLASGLQAAHDHGVIHRDVSPDNIVIPSGDVSHAKIIDFGIARSTQHGTVIGSGFAGKINYVSPEQLGLFGGDVTAKSDIYSLGLVLVQALAGRPIDMGGSQVEIIEKRRKIPDLGAIDMRIRPLFEQMLQPDPADRLGSMADVAAWSLGAPSDFRQADRPRWSATPNIHRNDLPKHGRRFWAYTVPALIIALIGGVGTYLYYYGSQAPLVPSAPAPNLDNGTDPGMAAAPSRAENIRHFVEKYDGGDCFFVSAVAVSDKAAALEGFGASTKPFNKLDADFRRALGFDADIGIRQITEPQCPAITFLDQIRNEQAQAPHLDIDKDNLHNGEVLSGMIDRFGDRNINLILISDGGTVQSLSNLLKTGTDAKTFKIGMQRADGDIGRQPQLLMAISTLSPLASLRPGPPVAATAFFGSVLNDAAGTGQVLSATVRYFMLEK